MRFLSKMELVSRALTVIKGETNWWKELEGRWFTFDHVFSPIHEEADLMTQLGTPLQHTGFATPASNSPASSGKGLKNKKDPRFSNLRISIPKLRSAVLSNKFSRGISERPRAVTRPRFANLARTASGSAPLTLLKRPQVPTTQQHVSSPAIRPKPISPARVVSSTPTPSMPPRSLQILQMLLIPMTRRHVSS
ncbi:hypothetical protein S83_031311 [Arachis hypogaea]